MTLEVMDAITDVHLDGTTIMMVTHDPACPATPVLPRTSGGASYGAGKEVLDLVPGRKTQQQPQVLQRAGCRSAIATMSRTTVR